MRKMGDVEEVLQLVKGCLPQLHITKENLLHPTPELVFKVYSSVVNEYNEAVYFLTGIQVPNDISTDLAPEERLFQQLSKLLENQPIKCKLSDIYAPIAMRTKNFFRICVHYIVFIQNLLNTERDLIENEVFRTKEDTSKLLIEQEELLNEINENARNKELLERNHNLLKQVYKSTKNAYKEMRELKASKEKLNDEKKQQIETLKSEMQNQDYKLKCLDNMEKDLLQQRITKGEYHNILQTVETLKIESEALDNYDVNMGDGLVHENEILQHTADCLGVLNQFDFNVQDVKNLICHEEESKVISNTQEKLKEKEINFIRQQKPEGERKLLQLESFAALQNDYKEIEEHYIHSINQFSQEIVRCKADMEQKSQSNTQAILKYKEDIKKLEEDMEKLKKTFTNEYIKVSKVERRVVDNFKDFIMKCSNNVP